VCLIIRFFALTCFVVPMVFGSANAQEQRDPNGLYFRVATGVTFGNDMDQNLNFDPAALFTGSIPTQQQTKLNAVATFGGAIGFHYVSGTRTELEYRYSNANIKSLSRDGGVLLFPNDDLAAHFVMSNFYKDFDSSSAFTPYIGLGVGGGIVSNGLGDRDTAFAYQGRAGIAVNLSDGMSLDVEYNYLRTTGLEFGPDGDGLVGAALEPRQSGDVYSASSILISLRKEF